jgi:L-alanine-DL-glutamate epimerase-like enolase superfamily enzyme
LQEFGVSWFEQPVSSDDLDGLRMLRDRAPAGMDIAAGEYGYDLPYFDRMITLVIWFLSAALVAGTRIVMCKKS